MSSEDKMWSIFWSGVFLTLIVTVTGFLNYNKDTTIAYAKEGLQECPNPGQGIHTVWRKECGDIVKVTVNQTTSSK
jgi:hypothetical protein